MVNWSTDQISIANNFNKFFHLNRENERKQSLSNKNLTCFYNQLNANPLPAYVQADPVDVMEEIESLQNKMSQDFNVVSGFLMKHFPNTFKSDFIFVGYMKRTGSQGFAFKEDYLSTKRKP